MIIWHIGGRCEKCGPSAYVENPHSFLNKCLSGTRVETNGNFSSGSTSSSMPAPLPEYKNVKYDASLVHKAVHLIRNPFDNIVSRFHLEHHALVKRNDTESLKSYPNSKQGFRAFCHMLDLKFSREEKHSRFIESDIRFAMKDIPCHGDFIRYVQWHNLAFVTTDDLTLPTLVLRYENYENRFNETGKKPIIKGLVCVCVYLCLQSILIIQACNRESCVSVSICVIVLVWKERDWWICLGQTAA